MLQNKNEVLQDFRMHGFNRLEWEGTEGYNTHTHTRARAHAHTHTHTHTTLCGILTRNMKFTCLNSAVSNHLQ